MFEIAAGLIIALSILLFAWTLLEGGGGSTGPAPTGERQVAPEKLAKASSLPPPKASIAKVVPAHVSVDEDDPDITLITFMPDLAAEKEKSEAAKQEGGQAKAREPDEGREPPEASKPAGEARTEDTKPVAIEVDEAPSSSNGTLPSFVDEEAALEEQTRPHPVILVSAAGQSDRGRRRKRNEDSYVVLPDHAVYVIADGMGGYAGGAVASRIAVETIDEAFRESRFKGSIPDTIPKRGADLALSIHMANEAIFKKAKSDPTLAQMGTTIMSARFSPNKQRVYIGHVGDSRCYRLRAKELRQLSTDHTMAQEGLTGPMAAHLTRAVGIGPHVEVDLIIDKPRSEDVYVLCSDGLTKMVNDETIREILLAEPNLERCVTRLIEMANEKGGKDNVTVILVRVTDVRTPRAEAAS